MACHRIAQNTDHCDILTLINLPLSFRRWQSK